MGLEELVLRRRGLLLLLLLHFALALLNLLKAFLGRHGAIVEGLLRLVHGRADGGGRLIGLLFRLGLKILVRFLRLGAVVVVIARLRGAVGARAEQDVEGLTECLVAEDEDVVIDADEELREDFAGLAGAVIAKDALVAGEAFNLGAGFSGDLLEDGTEAGVIRDDVEAHAVVSDSGRGGWVVGGPFGLRRRHVRGRGNGLRGLAGSGLLWRGLMVRDLWLRWLRLSEGCGREQRGSAHHSGNEREAGGGAAGGCTLSRSRRWELRTHDGTWLPAGGEQIARHPPVY